MSLYKYVSIDVLKKVIAGTIRFTQPGAFNDPFEMLPELHIPEEVPQNLNFSFDIESPRRIPAVGELPHTFASDYCNDHTSRLIIKELDQKIGVLCLSKNSNSLLMWSHYASQYAGAVIEFNETHEFFKGQIEIEYKSERPKKDISAYLFESKDVPIAELCVKPDVWSYESEVRIIRNLDNCKKVSDAEPFPIYVMNVPIEAIKSITLGRQVFITYNARPTATDWMKRRVDSRLGKQFYSHRMSVVEPVFANIGTNTTIDLPQLLGYSFLYIQALRLKYPAAPPRLYQLLMHS